MKTVRFLGNSKVDVIEVPDPEPGPGEVVVKVMTSALCGSEMRNYRAPRDPDEATRSNSTILNNGHELVGELVDANGQSGLKKGSRFAINIITGCGECDQCRSGDRRFCKKQGYVMGGHAQYISVPANTLMPLPDDLDYETGVLIGGDTLGVASRALAHVPLRPRDRVLVVGAGPVGLGFVSMLHYFGLETIVSEPSAFRRTLVEAFGAKTIDPSAGHPHEQLMAVTNGQRVDLGIDASGRGDGVVLALESIRPLGQMIFAGAGREANINPWEHFLEKEISARGVWYFTDEDYYRLLGLYRKGLDPKKLITHRFAIDDANTAYDEFAHALTGKVVLHANGNPGDL